MTEKEAHMKLCPFITEAMLGQGNGGPFCFASACMAWKQIETTEFQQRADLEFRLSGYKLISDEGYCSLAGK